MKSKNNDRNSNADSSSKAKSSPPSSVSVADSYRSLYKEVDMRVNHVVSLKATNDFNEGDRNVHLEHNRVLQEWFHSGNPTELLDMIRRNYPKGSQAWTTDFIQPTPKAALGLNIAADLIVSYQVKVDDYQSVMDQVYNEILEKDAGFETTCQEQIQQKMQESEGAIQKKENELYALFVKNKPDAGEEELARIHQDARKLAEYAIGKQVTSEVVGKYVADKMPGMMDDLKIPTKPVYDKSTNHDVAILGAAGSGKSHLLRTNMPGLVKKEMITLATDDYRGIHVPGTTAHESKETQQVFSRTQDSAYMVKELVMSRMSQLINAPQRANILFDGITYERFLNPLIEPSKENFQSMVACLPEAREAPNRAFDRAVNSSDPADKGRFVNTEALIAGHKTVSGAALIDGVPANAASTKLVNTFTQHGEAPREFGSISHERTALGGIVANIRITDVKTACDYFGKQNLNSTASMRQEIYSHRQSANDTDTFKYNDYHKARSLLSLASLSDPAKPWIKEKALEFGEPPYVNIRLAHDGDTGKYRFDIEVLDEARYKAALHSDKTPESKANSTLLKEVVSQAKTYNKLEMTEPFSNKEANTEILSERRVLGVKNLEREFIPKM